MSNRRIVILSFSLCEYELIDSFLGFSTLPLPLLSTISFACLFLLEESSVILSIRLADFEYGKIEGMVASSGNPARNGEAGCIKEPFFCEAAGPFPAKFPLEVEASPAVGRGVSKFHDRTAGAFISDFAEPESFPAKDGREVAFFLSDSSPCSRES